MKAVGAVEVGTWEMGSDHGMKRQINMSHVLHTWHVDLQTPVSLSHTSNKKSDI